MSISDLYETLTPDPALSQVLEVKVSHVGGAHGGSLEVVINLEDACLDVAWKRKEDVIIELSYMGKTITADRQDIHKFRLAQAGLFTPNQPMVLEAREPRRKGKLYGALEFTLAPPPSMKKRGRILMLRQLVERTISNVREDPSWKKLLPWYSALTPEEARFDAAVKAILAEGRTLVPQLSGVDISIALSETPAIKTWLILMNKDEFIQKVRTVEDLAHEANIRDAELITNKMVQILFGQ